MKTILVISTVIAVGVAAIVLKNRRKKSTTLSSKPVVERSRHLTKAFAKAKHQHH